MYTIPNARSFWMMLLAGVLIIGTPAGVLGAEADASSVDHSMEGQISRPSSSGSSEAESLVDDSTDNTYGYYTIMGSTTVTVEAMVSQYNEQNVEYPSGILTEGGAPDIDTFCEIIVEEADAEGVRGEVVYEQAMPDGFSLEEMPVLHSLTFPGLAPQEAVLQGTLSRMSAPGSVRRYSI